LYVRIAFSFTLPNHLSKLDVSLFRFPRQSSNEPLPRLLAIAMALAL
jgi:hypothetical protein